MNVYGKGTLLEKTLPLNSFFRGDKAPLYLAVSVGLSVTHSFNDPHVAPYWPTWPCSIGILPRAYSTWEIAFHSNAQRRCLRWCAKPSRKTKEHRRRERILVIEAQRLHDIKAIHFGRRSMTRRSITRWWIKRYRHRSDMISKRQNLSTI